jgi:hypothetical protein
MKVKLNWLTCGPRSPGSPYRIDNLNKLVFHLKQKKNLLDLHVVLARPWDLSHLYSIIIKQNQDISHKFHIPLGPGGPEGPVLPFGPLGPTSPSKNTVKRSMVAFSYSKR